MIRLRGREMADAVVGACNCSSFAIAQAGTVKGGLVPCAVSFPLRNRTQFLCSPESLSFTKTASRHLQASSSPSYSHQRLQVCAVVGYPASITWWNKRDVANMREINSTQEFVEALSKAGEKLVVVEFYSIGCRSCKALYPKLCQIAAEHPDIDVLKVDFYDNKPMCRSLNVKILPFFHFYRGAEGRLDAFSCSLSKLNKLREAIVKYKSDWVSIGSTVAAGKHNNLLALSTSALATAGSAI